MTKERDPHVNYERAVICGVLEDPDSMVPLASTLTVRDFSDTRNAVLWAYFIEWYSKGIKAEPVRLTTQLESDGVPGEYVATVRQYLSEDVRIFSTEDAPLWAKWIIDDAKKRRICKAIEPLLSIAHKKHDYTSIELAAEVLTALASLRESSELQGFRFLKELKKDFEIMVEEWTQGRLIDKIATGFKDLDKKIGGGLGKGQLTILGGRPGTMKTAFAWLIARNIAQNLSDTGESGYVAFASLEMKGLDLLKRGVCAEALINSTDLEGGTLSKDDHKRLRQATNNITALPIKVFDEIATSDFLHYETMSMIQSSTDGDLKLLIVDFAEMVADDGKSEEARVSGIFKAAKNIAKLQNIPVIILSQLNREVEREQSRIPGLHHLRWGGAAEAVADSVLFTYYPYLYQARGETIHPPSDFGFLDMVQHGDRATKVNKSMWWLIVAKSRYGSSGLIRFNVVPEYTVITDFQQSTKTDGVVTLKTMRVDDF